VNSRLLIIETFIIRDTVQAGACQGSCRLSHAANG
jgi:hypothetical protein